MQLNSLFCSNLTFLPDYFDRKSPTVIMKSSVRIKKDVILASGEVISIIDKPPKYKVGYVGLTTLAILALFALGSGVESFDPPAADPLIWVVTNQAVRSGTGRLIVDYRPISPCDIDVNMDLLSEQDVKKSAYHGLEKLCRKEYDTVNRPLLQEFVDAFRNQERARSRKKGGKRQKRELITLAVVLIVVTVISIVGWMAQAIYSYSSSSSSYNRLNEKDIDDKKRDEKLNAMELQLKEARDIRSGLLNITDQLDKRITSNSEAINQIATMMPYVSISAANFTLSIHNEREALRRMAYQAARGRASPDDYATFFRFPQLFGLKPEATHLRSIDYSMDGVISIDMFYDLYASDTQVYRLQPLAHYVDFWEKPTLVRYAGPGWAIHNTTSNCSKGIEDPTYLDVFDTCTVQDFADPRLDNWVPVKPGDPDYEKFSSPQRAESPLENIISCLFHNITIDGRRRECPYYPFRIPVTVPFELENSVHTVKSDRVEIFAKNVGYQTPRFEERQGESKTGTLIKNLYERNLHSLEAKQFALDKDTLAIPLTPLGIVSVLVVLSLMIVLGIWMASCCLCNRPSPTGGITNVINGANPPSPSPLTTFVPDLPPRRHSLFSMSRIRPDTSISYYATAGQVD